VKHQRDQEGPAEVTVKIAMPGKYAALAPSHFCDWQAPRTVGLVVIHARHRPEQVYNCALCQNENHLHLHI
jgi:hypothetical protein